MPPTLLEPPAPRPRVPRSRYRRWTWRRQLKASGLRLVFLAVFATAIWGAWYLANKGFGRQWRLTVVEELRKRGVEASVRRLTLDPFRGLVAQDVRIYDFRNRDNPLAVISEVALDINYAALLHRQPFLNALDIRDADVTFPNPGGDPKAPKAQLKQFRAHVYFPPEQIHISQAEGVFCGVRISATGHLIKRNDYKPTRTVSDEEWRQRAEILQRVATELGRFQFAGGPPSLQVKFSGDLAQMEDAHIEASLEAEDVERGAYKMKTVAAAGEWRDRALTVTRCEWSDAGGRFSARGGWSGETRIADFEAQSSADAKGFLDAFGFPHLLQGATFSTPPAIELSGRADFSHATPRTSILGRVTAGPVTYKGVPVLNVAAAFSWDGQRTLLRDVRLRHESGEIVADLLDAPGDFRLNVDSTVNPSALRPLVASGLRKFLGEWEWPRPPAVRMSIRGRSRDPRTWSADGHVALQRTRFRGVWMNRATADVRLKDGSLGFENLHVARDEGVGTGSFAYDFVKHEVRVQNVRTSLKPADAIYWIEPKLFKVVTPYQFRTPPHLTANGVVTLKGRNDTQLEIGVTAPAGMDYVFLGETLPFEEVTGRLVVTDDRVQVLDLSGALFGGKVRGAIDVSIAKNDERYGAQIEVEGVDFPKLTKLYFDYDTARGQLAGSYDFTVTGGDTRTMRGSGKMKVSNGSVFAIPIFGPLSGLVSAIIPGAGYSVAKQATASFTVKDGVIHTDDFKVSGKLFGMRGHGDIHFLDDKLDFDIRIDATGAGVVLTPMYKLFEYKGEGSLKKPTWHPKHL